MLNGVGHMGRLLAMPPVSLGQPHLSLHTRMSPKWLKKPPDPDLCSSCRLPGSGRQLTS